MIRWLMKHIWTILAVLFAVYVLTQPQSAAALTNRAFDQVGKAGEALGSYLGGLGT